MTDRAETPARDEPTAPASARRLYALTAFFLVEFLALAAFQSPYRTFDQFALWDSGGDLVIQHLMRRGWTPTVDFGYLYGLLGLLVGRVYYTFAPISPGAFRVEVVACSLLSAWGLARFAHARRLGPVGVALLALAVPDLLLVTYITLTHVLEQALLLLALAELGRGRRGPALALATACWFVKPSQAALIGLALVVMIVIENRRAGLAAWARGFGPAVVTGTVLAVVLGVVFGPWPLLRTLFPITGREVYRLNGFGFFLGQGRTFWALPNAGLKDYFRYETGFYLLGTAVLAGGAAAALGRLTWGEPRPDEVIDDEVVITCAAVHLGFIAVFFGHHNTWYYSLPMLVAGLAVLSRRGRRCQAAVGILALMLLVSDRSKSLELVHRWRTTRASAATLGLWSSAADREEWTTVMELARGDRAVLFALCEGAALLLPGFEPPVSGYIVAGLPVPAEIDRKLAQLRRARTIIAHEPVELNVFRRWPELKAALDDCDLIYQGRVLKVYRRSVKGPAAKYQSKPITDKPWLISPARIMPGIDASATSSTATSSPASSFGSATRRAARTTTTVNLDVMIDGFE